jgi:sarcosine oxidase gamma subunit
MLKENVCMRDFAGKWSPVPDWSTARIEQQGVSVKPLIGLNQTLISGRLDTALAGLTTPIRVSGAADPVDGDPYAVRLARDRMLLISSAAADLTPGWHDGGYAVSRMDDAYQVIQIEGFLLPEILSRGTSLDFSRGGSSVATRFAGVAVLLYRYQNSTRLRIHVEHGLAAYLWRWIERCSVVGATGRSS